MFAIVGALSSADFSLYCGSGPIAAIPPIPEAAENAAWVLNVAKEYRSVY
jgi:hypothetical protein